MKKVVMLVTLLGLVFPAFAKVNTNDKSVVPQPSSVVARHTGEVSPEEAKRFAQCCKETSEKIRKRAAQTAKQAPTPAQEVNYLILSNQINEKTDFQDVVQFLLMAQEDDAVVDSLLRAVDITHRPLAHAAALYPMVKNKNIDDQVKANLNAKYTLCNEKNVDAKTLAEYDEAVKVKHMQIMEQMGRKKISPVK